MLINCAACRNGGGAICRLMTPTLSEELRMHRDSEASAERFKTGADCGQQMYEAPQHDAAFVLR